MFKILDNTHTDVAKVLTRAIGNTATYSALASINVYLEREKRELAELTEDDNNCFTPTIDTRANVDDENNMETDYLADTMIDPETGKTTTVGVINPGTTIEENHDNRVARLPQLEVARLMLEIRAAMLDEQTNILNPDLTDPKNYDGQYRVQSVSDALRFLVSNERPADIERITEKETKLGKRRQQSGIELQASVARQLLKETNRNKHDTFVLKQNALAIADTVRGITPHADDNIDGESAFNKLPVATRHNFVSKVLDKLRNHYYTLDSRYKRTNSPRVEAQIDNEMLTLEIEHNALQQWLNAFDETNSGALDEAELNGANILTPKAIHIASVAVAAAA